MADDRDPYSVLGIERDCDQEALKKRYQALAKELHPDRNVQCSDDERKRKAEVFQKVDRAYRLLADAAVRESVNAQIASKEVHNEWPVSEIVHLSEMECSDHGAVNVDADEERAAYCTRSPAVVEDRMTYLILT